MSDSRLGHGEKSTQSLVPNSSTFGHARKPTDHSIPSIPGFLSKEAPTGLAAEPLNIIILGTSFGGLSCAHHFLDVIYDELAKNKVAGISYRLVLVGPSTHMYWNIGAPRILVKPGLIKAHDQFRDIEEGFYEGASNQSNRAKKFTIIQGRCVSMDTTSRTVLIECTEFLGKSRLAAISPKRNGGRPQAGNRERPSMQTLPYHALIVCTGTSARSDLLSLHGRHQETQAALESIHTRLADPKTQSIVVGGGGCSGVEVAGQLATYLNWKSRFPFRVKANTPKQITLLSGGSCVLKEVAESGHPEVSAQAERRLKKLGVAVQHHTRVKGQEANSDSPHKKTCITFEDGSQQLTDVYIDCTGVEPNSDFAPDGIKNDEGYIQTNPRTMRVDAAGERVYAIGDVASYSKNHLPDVYRSIPIVMQNLSHDLSIDQRRRTNPDAGFAAEEMEATDTEWYRPAPKHSLICPISRFGGVGIWAGWRLPSLGVYLLKGRDYRVGQAKKVVSRGETPYAMPMHVYRSSSGKEG